MNTPDFEQTDGTTRCRYWWTGTTLTRAWDSLDESRIVAENQALSGEAKTLSWCRPVLRMSWAQYWFFLRRYPELDPRSKAPVEDRRRALGRLAADRDFSKLVVGKY